MSETPVFTPSEFIDVCNQTLEYAYASVVIEGEVSGYKVSQGKWIFFDLKDEESSVNCFATVFKLRTPVEDGMRVRLRATPKLTKWGKFSLTVEQIVPVGEGNLKKSFELLKRKLASEGLFDPLKKRILPENPTKIGVISSIQAAGYADFIKILGERWGGLKIKVAHTQVQGFDAPDQIIRALKYFNEHADVEVIALIRGGGSADDLAVFNDEKLVRAVAASRIPVITGIGHEVDESLADLAADVRASTPSNAAERLTRDRRAEIAHLRSTMNRLAAHVLDRAKNLSLDLDTKLADVRRSLKLRLDALESELASKMKLIDRLNPENVLAQGYSIVTGRLQLGNVVKITTETQTAEAEIKKVKERNAHVAA